jgi:hypothetical protein
MSAQIAVNLDDYKGLFRDDRSYHEFVGVLKEAASVTVLPIFSGQELLGGITSPGGVKESLSERFLKRLAERPDLLSEIADRMENDEIVE